MKRKLVTAILNFVFLSGFISLTMPALGQGTVFTYQGRLDSSGAPANGSYDFRFTTFGGATGGGPVSTTVVTNGVAVSNGLFIVQLDFGAGVFVGPARWLEIAVKTNASFDSHTVLTPRQALTATPYAMYAGEASASVIATTASIANSTPWSGITGVPTGFGDGVDNDTTYTAGAGLALGGNTFSLNTTVTDARYWRLAGNAAVSGDFLGTINNQPLDLRANNARALRLEPGTTAPNLIGGLNENRVASGVSGAVIGGGGRAGEPNVITANHAAIAGGYRNTNGSLIGFIGGGAEHETLGLYAAIAGGFRNFASDAGAVVGGVENTAANSGFVGGGGGNAAASAYSVVNGGVRNKVFAGPYSVIGGGHENVIPSFGDYSLIDGGKNNTNAGLYSVIGGGATNRISRNYSVIGGGWDNFIAADYSTVSGGKDNRIETGSFSATIGGGIGNTLSNSFWALISGGQSHELRGSQNATIGGGHSQDLFNSANATISGGGFNRLIDAVGSVIAGGEFSQITNADFSVISGGEWNSVHAAYSGIGSGISNTIASSAATAFIGGGQFNEVTSAFSAVAGGRNNTATAEHSFVGGGSNNDATGGWNTIGGGAGNTTSASHATVAGGWINTASDHKATVGGGSFNVASGFHSTVPGGANNQAQGDYSLAAGRLATAAHSGSFVWADDLGSAFSSTTTRQFAVRANNGVMIQSTNTALDLRGGGAVRVAGAGVGTGTPLFIHRASAANTGGHITTIDHPHCNGNPNAILIITHNYSADTAASRYETAPVGVWYNAPNWTIFHEDISAMPVGRAFNVMVVKP